MAVGDIVVQYGIEKRTPLGNWVDQGYCFETKEEAIEEARFLEGFEGEKHRVYACTGRIIFEADKK